MVRARTNEIPIDALAYLRCVLSKGAHRYPGAFVGDTPGSHLPPDFYPLQDSI
eukprot:COSAG01_NODE_12729_length_1693_cov_1.376412_1_plen_52_part_10